MQTMKALFLDKKGALSPKVIEKPQIAKGNEILIKISYSGLCGTDLHIIAGHFPSAKDIVIGHEFVGTVEEIGNEVRGFNLGDKVAVDPNHPCKSCDHCFVGETHFCLNGGPRRAYGVQQSGGCAEYVIVPEDIVYPIGSSLTLKEAVFIEPISCIVRGRDNLGELKPNARVLIQGAGIIGLLWTCILQKEGHNLTISDTSAGRRKTALDLTGSFSNDPKPEVVDVQSLEGVVEKFDIVVDCSGSPKAIESAIGLLKRGGKLSIFSCCPTEAKISISPFELYRKELTIISSFINPGTFRRSVELAEGLKNAGYLDLDKLGAKLFALDDIDVALDALKNGEISKAVFVMTEPVRTLFF